MNHFEQLLYITLRIEVLGEGSNVISIGTGFLLAKPIDSIRGKVYLISNRHVLDCVYTSYARTSAQMAMHRT